MRYRITSAQGVELGTYEANSEAEALNKLARDAGYKDQADAEQQIPTVNRNDMIVEQA